MSKKRRSKIEIKRMGNSKEDFYDIWALTLRLHKKGGFAPLHEEKAKANVYHILSEGYTYGAYYKDECIGTLGMIELQFWYSAESFLQDAWLYVDPEYRYENVGVKLLIEARKLGDEMNKIIMLTVTDPDRPVRSGKIAKWAVLAGYVPMGHTSILNKVDDNGQELQHSSSE